MKNLLTTVIVIFILSSFGCKKDDPVTDNIIVNLPTKSSAIITANNQFGFDIFKEINAAESEEKNLFISPTSITMALSMALNGADGNTLTEMIDAMAFDGLTTMEINEIQKELKEVLSTIDPNVIMNIANSIWYREDFYVENDFLSVNEDYYDAEVSALDFNDPASVITINNWVAEKTNNLIDKIIEQISASTVMFITNAIYFKGTWQYEFDPQETADHYFTTNTGTENVKMMSQEVNLNYYENEDLQIVEMPYSDGHYNMLVLLPKSHVSTDSIINILDSQYWENLMSMLSPTEEINLFLPKFKFAFESELKPFLKNMGMQEAFTAQADLSNINPDANIYISSVLHKSFVEVNEEGTEAAAVTNITIELSSIPSKPFFVANHPFLFFIIEKNTNSIVFLGEMNNPNKN